jgi:hypothetical protein
MPLTLNVGLSKKVGEPDYGSRGASVNLELELDSGTVNEPDRLRDRIRQMFHLARDAIREELAGNGTPAPQASAPLGPPAPGAANGGYGGNHGNRDRPATQSQVRALHAITRKQGLNLSQLVRQRFLAQRPEDLSLRDASALIDELNRDGNGGTNGNGSGNGDRR